MAKMTQIPLITAWETGNSLPPKRPRPRPRQSQKRKQHEECKTCAFSEDGWCDSGDVDVGYKCPSRIPISDADVE